MRIHRALLVAAAAAGLCPGAENTAFYEAIRGDHQAALQKLIHNAGVTVRDSRGNSPLMYAAALGSLESVRLLLDAGADPNAPNDFAATPLMWCAGDGAKVRLLLARGAKVEARSNLGRTALMIAAAYDGSAEAARLMIEHGADVNARDKGGNSVLEQAASSNNIEVARLLIAKGANVNNSMRAASPRC